MEIDIKKTPLNEQEIFEQLKVEDEDKYLTFSLEHQLYGIEILQIREIIKPITVTRLPNTPLYILGVINLRGEIIPVIDIKKRFGLERIQFSANTRIIVVEINGKLLGLYVESVHQVVPIRRGEIEQPQEDIAGISINFFSGYKTLKGSILLILAIENLIEEITC